MRASVWTKHASNLTIKLVLNDTHHPLNELWPPLEKAYELQIWNSDCKHMYIQIYWRTHTSFKPNLENISLAPPSWELQLANVRSSQILFETRRSSFQIFQVMELVSMWKRLILKYIGGSGLNCPWYWGYESSKFIWMHMWVIHGWPPLTSKRHHYIQPTILCPRKKKTNKKNLFVSFLHLIF